MANCCLQGRSINHIAPADLRTDFSEPGDIFSWTYHNAHVITALKCQFSHMAPKQTRCARHKYLHS